MKAVMGAIAGATGIYARDFRSRMLVVAFHRVNDRLPADGLTCTSAQFEAFCRFFRKYFRVVPFEEQVLACARGEDMGGTLSITFDDGYLDNIEVAAPILRKYRLPATFFVTTGFIGSKRVPFWDEELPVQPGWMSWEQVRELASQGFAIGCHTDTHIDMGQCDEATVRAELTVSKRKLEEALGREVKLFVYPFGGEDQLSVGSLDLVKELGFISCASCFGGTNGPIVDPYAIKRIGIASWFALPHQFGAELLLGKV
jgi:peptidoglycan/xylan/chitin deacetylase (PgdA/CDA1 family)